MKVNKNIMIFHICDMSNNTVDHFVQQMLSGFELSMVVDVTYFPDFQVKQMKDYTFDSQSIYVGSSCTQLLWSSQVLKDVTKDGNEDFNQDVLDNMCDMLVTGFPI